jgi:hypothetical protein
VFGMKRDLVRRQVDLTPSSHNFQLDHDKLTMRERNQAIGYAEIYPRLNAGDMGAWEVFFQPLVQVCFRFHWHPLPPRLRC